MRGQGYISSHGMSGAYFGMTTVEGCVRKILERVHTKRGVCKGARVSRLCHHGKLMTIPGAFTGKWLSKLWFAYAIERNIHLKMGSELIRGNLKRYSFFLFLFLN